ncbi:hypothetical protein [Nocardiopsis sp. NPDC055824]
MPNHEELAARLPRRADQRGHRPTCPPATFEPRVLPDCSGDFQQLVGDGSEPFPDGIRLFLTRRLAALSALRSAHRSQLLMVGPSLFSRPLPLIPLLKGTVGKNRSMANKHLLPYIGKAKLKDLSADDVDA